jgi:hypothetical protein
MFGMGAAHADRGSNVKYNTEVLFVLRESGGIE